MFTRLLTKIEEQRKAYGGKVFDVLGEAFIETPLRELLLEAIRYGELPEVAGQDAPGHRRAGVGRSAGVARRAGPGRRAPRRSGSRRSCGPRWTRPGRADCSPITSNWRSRPRSSDSAAALPTRAWPL